MSTDRDQLLHALCACYAGQQQLAMLTHFDFIDDLTVWRVEPVVTRQWWLIALRPKHAARNAKDR